MSTFEVDAPSIFREVQCLLLSLKGDGSLDDGDQLTRLREVRRCPSCAENLVDGGLLRIGNLCHFLSPRQGFPELSGAEEADQHRVG